MLWGESEVSLCSDERIAYLTTKKRSPHERASSFEIFLAECYLAIMNGALFCFSTLIAFTFSFVALVLVYDLLMPA